MGQERNTGAHAPRVEAEVKTEPLTNEMIRALAREAAEAGDEHMHVGCMEALQGDPGYRAACAKTINDARAQDDSRPFIEVVP